MHPLRKKRLMMVLFIMTFSALGIALLVFAMRENLNLFFPPAEVASGKAPRHQTIRVGGYVVKDSVERLGEGLQVRFRLTDGWAETTVLYTGILPDLFSEGEAAVAKGKINDNNELESVEVLAKHDENYTPPEVSDSAVKPH
jgi:cytochrome c-type biogenesis protein CcmE